MHRVLVAGLPRGGTTWVGRALGHAPGAVYVHEPDGAHEPYAYRARIMDGLAYHTVLRREDDAREYERLWAGAFSGGRPHGSISDRVARWTFRRVSAQTRRTAFLSRRLPPGLRLAVRAARPLAERSDVDAVVVKTVNAALAVEWIAERFTSEVLVVRRDVRNVVGSWLAIGFATPAPAAYDAMRNESRERWDIDPGRSEDPLFRTAVVCTVMSLGLLDALRRNPSWHSISHEIACQDPVPTLRRAAEQVGLRWSESAREFVESSNRPGDGYVTTRIAADLPEQWRSRLDPRQQETVETLLARYPDALWQFEARR